MLPVVTLLSFIDPINQDARQGQRQQLRKAPLGIDLFSTNRSVFLLFIAIKLCFTKV